jgi:hypothetical protein
MVITLLLNQAWMPVAGSSPSAVPQRNTGGTMNVSGALAGPPVDATSGGLDITLSEGSEQPQSAVTSTVVVGEPLTAEETAALLGRLPELPVEVADSQEFRLPPESLPPPSPETEIDVAFPPTETLTTTVEVVVGDLEVLRYAPEGEIRMAPFLQVTFDQPMVAMGTLEQLEAEEVPVILTPQLPGVWKWLGTKTLTFEYRGEEIDRFPMATQYTAEVPEGTTSAVGGVLKESVRWNFATPPPGVTISHPGQGPQSLDPLMFVAFDQRIDAQAVLNTIQVVANGASVDVRMAAEEEVLEDPRVLALSKQAGEGRWLAFRASAALPYNATVNVNIGPNTPSAEGPRVTEKVQSYGFQTYGPLRITKASCAWSDSNVCPLGSPFSIQFSNPLDNKVFDPAWVSVTPEIPGMVVNAYGSSLEISGAMTGRTRYEVTVRAAVQDIFGQTLGEDETVTFSTESAYPMLTGPQGPLTTTDPEAAPTFVVYSVNYPRLHVRVYEVTPDDWSAWQAYLRDYWQEPTPEVPGELVKEETVATNAEGDEIVETVVELSDVLGERTSGQFIVIVDLPRPLFGQSDRTSVQSWVQVTNLALDAFSDSENLLVWATRLSDGAAIGGATVELEGTSLSGETAADGTLPFTLDYSSGTLLVGRHGDELTILPRSMWDYWGESGWKRIETSDELRWYVFDDRQMYRPGEEVHIKGWIRRFGYGPEGDIGLKGDGPTSVRYMVSDAMTGATIAEETVELNDLGGFDFAFTLPENANLGYTAIYFTANGASNVNSSDFYHTIQVQEFRRPEFSVTAQLEEQGPYYLTEDAVASVSAQYYAGGPLPGAETIWRVTAAPGSYSPPNWPDYTFGTWTPWWRGGYDVMAEFSDGRYLDSTLGGSESDLTWQGVTDPTGKHYLRMTFNRSDEPRPYTVNADATVMDVNRQAWTSSTSLLVHPSELYVGLHSASTFVEAGDPLKVDIIVTDVDGNPVAERPLQVMSARQEWKYVLGEWTQVDVDVQTCELVSGNEPVQCDLDTALGGEYRIWAQVRDDKERLNRSEFTRWVSGGRVVPAYRVEKEEVTLIPDKESYKAGDIAKVLVQSPWTPAEGLLTVARNGFVYTERFQIAEGSGTISIPIEESYVPNVSVIVDLTGSAQRLGDDGEPIADAPNRPAFARGTISLSVPPVNRTLTLETKPEATEMEPGSETSIEVVARDSQGEPVENAELAVVVVDEAILALTGYSIPDPLLTFYREVGAGVESAYLRDTVALVDPATMAAQATFGRGGGGGGGAEMADGAVMMSAMPAPAAAEAPSEEMAFAPAPTMMPKSSADQGQGETPIDVRTDFNPLAVFAPAERTDAEGRITVKFTLPDNLTRYRVTVVAARERDFGSAESNLTARLPLMVRPSAPRFLNFGDEFEFPVVLQNQTDADLSVDVAMATANLALDEQVGKRVTVPANNRIEVRFPATTVNAGTARFQVAAASGDYADASSGLLPVYTPATTEAFATYGVVDTGAVAQPLTTPTGVFPQFGGLEISTSSTALSALTDAVLYLYRYPFECAEQIASRILGVAALRDVLTAFQAVGLPEPAVINGSMEIDIQALQALQNSDGGWPVWTRGKESVPFYSIHAAHALQIARNKDYKVSDETLTAALDYLRSIESTYPSWYSEITRRTLSSYALFVRDLMGDTDAAKARKLINEKPLDEQSLEAIGWLWEVLSADPASTAEVEAIRIHVNNSAVETASEANFYTSYGDQEWVLLHSNRRTDAILLDAMINDVPESDLIPKVVNGLLAHRSDGRWDNTQENVFVLLALDRYFNTFESVAPDFIARVWLGDTYVAEHAYLDGYTTDAQQTTVPMEFLVQGEGEQDIVLAKEGEGRLYYRLGLSYAPDDLKLDSLDMGFVVQRVYEAVDDPDDVQRDDDGTWRIRAGSRVRVRLTMVADNRRYHVALVDPLPAGFEPINPALAVSESLPGDPIAQPYGWWWYSTWYEHQNLRDSRAEAFTSLLWDGVYEYIYVARATTPGDFVVPPAKAEEMYSPEVFGRSGSERVVIE